MKKLNKYMVSPEYQRIPHLNKEISNMTHDDIQLESPVAFPLDCFVQEKLDAANLGVSWLNDGPIVRNREHILSKGYTKIRTPAKKQFTSTWNWVHAHEDDIKEVEKTWQSPITIFGEWMYAEHSIFYDRLPDLFIAYDIWSVEDEKFLSPDLTQNLLDKTNIKYIRPDRMKFNNIDEVVRESKRPSEYRNGVVEGIVIKTSSGYFTKSVFKVVNNLFVRRMDFNEELRKNKIIT